MERLLNFYDLHVWGSLNHNRSTFMRDLDKLLDGVKPPPPAFDLDISGLFTYTSKSMKEIIEILADTDPILFSEIKIVLTK